MSSDDPGAMMQATKDRLIEQTRHLGADFIAVAGAMRLASIETRPIDLLARRPRTMSMAVRLAEGVMDGAANGPTELSSRRYARVNALLDDIAARVVGFLQSHGGKALPPPTDAPFKNRCVSCTACMSACPSGTVKGTNTDLHDERLSDAVDLNFYEAQLNVFFQAEQIAPYLREAPASSRPWGVQKEEARAVHFAGRTCSGVDHRHSTQFRRRDRRMISALF